MRIPLPSPPSPLSERLPSIPRCHSQALLPIILVLAFRSLTRDSRQEVLGTRAVDGQSHCPLSSLVAHSQWQPFIDGPVYSDTQLGYSTGLVAGALFNLDTLLGLARSEITHWKTKVDFLFHELYL
jgi:hypothetical protein